MTTAELLVALARECPNGVSFNPMAVRLLRQKVPVEDWQIEDLKAMMFQLGNGLWFSPEMISDDESRLAFEGQAMEWLTEHGCFSVERLFEDFSGVLHHIDTPEVCAAFLRHLGFMVAEWGKGGHLCSLPSPNLDDSLAAISETIAGWLEEADGTLTFYEIEQAMPHLTAEALEGIRVHFLPEVHEAEVGGVLCWCRTESIMLPEDFSEKVTTVVDTLVALEEKVSIAKLEFALNLFYRARFREEYALLNNGTFMRVCAKHYQGGNDVFPNKMKSRARANESSVSGSRVRSPNTRFSNLGVPVGAQLVFTKDPHISCVVLDDINQVAYAGKAYAISALAIHLLGVSSANGFCHFSYEGEILWDRRLRLKRTDNQGENDVSPNKMKSRARANESSVSGSRVRSPNTRFSNLGVPVGAELVFTKDPHISCVVLDDINQVEYAGKAYAISALAIHLLEVSSANGFCHFSYEGEILWDRRLRLKRADNQDEYQAEEMPPPVEVQDAEGKIIGLEGRPLSSSTWRGFRADGTNPRVAVWARRVENGESVEKLAHESGYAVSTMKVMISNYRLYFKVCKLNGIVPERDANV
jgi:hypothetical protein